MKAEIIETELNKFDQIDKFNVRVTPRRCEVLLSIDDVPYTIVVGNTENAIYDIKDALLRDLLDEKFI